MTVSISATNSGHTTNTSSNAPTVALGADVPAGATIFGILLNRTDESTGLTSISDPVNGTWSSPIISGPYDATGLTNHRTWIVRLHNSQALTDVANRTITATFGGTISSQIAFSWCSSDAGVLTDGNVATVAEFADPSTNIDSNTVSASGAGVLVGGVATNASQTNPEPTADGSGETRLTATNNARAHLFGEPLAAGGTVGLETTYDACGGVFHAVVFLEPAAGSTYKPRRGTLMGVG